MCPETAENFLKTTALGKGTFMTQKKSLLVVKNFSDCPKLLIFSSFKMKI